MEDSNDINDIYELIKDFKKFKKEFKKLNIDSSIINKINSGEINNKYYMKFNFTKIYIIDKKPIVDLLKEIKYKEIIKLLSEEEEDDDENDIKEKIKGIFKEGVIPKLNNRFDEINIYNTEKELDEIINEKKEVLLVNSDFFKILDIQYKKYKNKGVLFASNSNNNIIYFPEEKFSILINFSLSPNINTIINEIESNNANNIQINENKVESSINDNSNKNNQPSNDNQKNNDIQLDKMINHIQNNKIINNNISNISINNI